ncbi:MAG: DUF5069 domain-containing protein [Verrucomicrobia bacterium]|nr:DUF5069 domain-containing protein [Verrucomicrobiota bacterium]
MNPDLTKRPPRSPRCKLGGYVLLPRLLDKGRAALAGTLGDYKYGCPLDQHFLRFIGIDAEALKQQLATGKGDWEILTWIQENASLKRQPWEIRSWSDYHSNRGPDSDAETLGYFTQAVQQLSPVREDLQTWMDLLDVDDFVSYGGKA